MTAPCFKSDISSLPNFREFRVCSHPAAEKVYQAGVALTHPFLYQINLATKLFGPNIRPGKSFEELSGAAKVWKILKIASLFTLVIPLLTALLAAFGLILRLCASPFRPTVSLLSNSDLLFKKHQKGDELHLMTYNTALMPGFIRNLNNMRSSQTRAEEIGLEIAKLETSCPDILCLQECFDIQAVSILSEELKKIYPHILMLASPNETGLNSGLMIASKFEIKEIEFVKYKAAKDEDALACKGFLGACLDLGNQETCWIYNTHLQAKTGADFDTIRLAQLSQLKEHIKSNRETGDRVFVAGDFNLCPNQAIQLKDDLFSHFYDEEEISPQSWQGTFYKKTHETWGTSSWTREIEAEEGILDHFLSFSNAYSDFTIELVEQFDEGKVSGISDHLPLSLKITV